MLCSKLPFQVYIVREIFLCRGGATGNVISDVKVLRFYRQIDKSVMYKKSVSL